MLFRDTEKDAQLGIIHFDFNMKEINYTGPVFNGSEKPMTDMRDKQERKPKTSHKFSWNHSNEASQESLMSPNSKSKSCSKPVNHSKKSEFIRQVIIDHLFEYKSELSPSFLMEISNWKYTHILESSEKELYLNTQSRTYDHKHRSRSCKKDAKIDNFMFLKNCTIVYLAKLHNMIHSAMTGRQSRFHKINYDTRGYIDLRETIARTLVGEQE